MKIGLPLLPVLAVLAGCATPQPVLRPVEVDVPVATPCAAPPPRPAFALAQADAAAPLFTRVKAALIEIDQRRAYEAILESELTHCQ